MISRRAAPGINVIDIRGEVTGAAENILTDAYVQASADAQTIILNFAGLDYMNSSGIGLLVTLLIRAQRQKQKLFAVELSEHYQEIFELTRLNEAITLFPTEQAALTALNGSQ
jgi:anti-sigma B factor antagonist